MFTPTSSIVQGDTIRFKEAVFAGSFRSPKFVGERTITAKGLKESYGGEKQQHTFTLEIIACEGIEPLTSGTVTRRKGRNIYRNGTEREAWADEEARRSVASEKHARGDVARAAREERKNGYDRF
jgi:hypothetical protein